MQITVKTLLGTAITLEVLTSIQIGELKTKIQDSNGIPPYQQTLIFDTNKLKDGWTLSDYNIPDGSTILLLLKLNLNLRGSNSIHIYVKTVTGKSISLDVETSDTVGYVKTLIWDEEGSSPDQQWLVFGTTVLEDGETLAKYNVKMETTLHLLLRHRGVMRMMVKTLRGKSVSIEARSCDTIEKVKTRVEDKEGIPANHQRLIFGGRELEDERTLAEYDISNDFSVLLVINSPRRSSVTHIFLKHQEFTVFLDVSSSDTIANLKAKIQEKKGIPSKDQWLLSGAKHLCEDDWTLADYSIKDESTVRLLTPRFYTSTAELS